MLAGQASIRVNRAVFVDDRENNRLRQPNVSV